MTRDLFELAWPAEQLKEALEALARASGLPVRALDRTASLSATTGEQPLEELSKWLESAGPIAGLEIEPVQSNYGDVNQLIRSSAPALLRLLGDGRSRFLLLLAGGRRRVLILAPDLSRRRIAVESIRQVLCAPVEAPIAHETERLLEDVQVAPHRRARVARALARQQLAGTILQGCWIVRLPPGASMRAQMSQAHVGWRLLVLGAAHVVAYALWIVSWWILGRAALEGRLDRGWLLAWGLLLLTLVPFELMMTWLQGRVSIDVGALMKRRLLYGALRLEPEEIRHEGAGHLLGRVIESQAIEALTLTGGFLALAAALELAMAAVVLATAIPALAILLVACVAVGAAIAWRFFQRRKNWTASRLDMTHDLVEQMVGHRTRNAQQPKDAWHDEEDSTLERYVDASARMDRATVWLVAMAPRGWLLLAVAGLSPAFITGNASTATLAVAIGGILLAFRAFRRLAAGVSHLAGAAIAWKQAAPIFHAAARPQLAGSPAFSRPSTAADGPPLLDGHELSFRYRRRSEPVLRECSLKVRRGDRLLLQGPSGGGKSTLASLLTGLRQPESGLLLLDGIDRQTLGASAWRRRVVAVPQFHENHIFVGTLAFNLLMGAEWPPTQADVDRADVMCRALGLGGLLDRMPSGLMQQVGETGWQLSHGERSRVCVARALLQGGDFLVFDESFGQLDPESLQGTLRFVLERAPTVMVIAHP
jgi:ABC-type bacteriocin/lantibiotic exporter with double-glycine peptidase domain